MNVEPRWKQGRAPKAERRSLRRTRLNPIGKKGRRDRAELDAVRPLLIERSRGRCEAQCSPLCTGVGVHAHHVVLRAHGAGNEPAELLWVCAFCHDRIHWDPAAALMAGLLKPGRVA